MNPSATSDLYQRLNLPRDADSEQVRAAFRNQAKIYHPDRNPAKRAQAHEDFIALGEAFEVLSDPAKRAQYDLNQSVHSFRAEAARTPKSEDQSEGVYDFYQKFYDKSFGKGLEHIIMQGGTKKFIKNIITDYLKDIHK